MRFADSGAINGNILLADGLALVSLGEMMLVLQQNGLKFRPTAQYFGRKFELGLHGDPARNTAAPTRDASSPSNTPVVIAWRH
jgi:hypothetical protein